MPFVAFLVASLLFASGGLAMKYSVGLTRLAPSLAVFGCFAAGAACQALGMRQTEMGSAYVTVLGLEAVVAVVLAAAVLGERLNGQKVGAMVVIVAGIAWLHRS